MPSPLCAWYHAHRGRTRMQPLRCIITHSPHVLKASGDTRPPVLSPSEKYPGTRMDRISIFRMPERKAVSAPAKAELFPPAIFSFPPTFKHISAPLRTRQIRTHRMTFSFGITSFQAQNRERDTAKRRSMKTVLPGQARRRLDDRKTSPRKTGIWGKIGA